MKIHDRYYWSSVLNTLLFYGTVVLVCLVFNVFVALFIVVFFLRFYRREISAAIRHPVDTIFRPKPIAGGQYRFDVLPPGR